MGFQFFRRIFAAALVVVTFVHATPFWAVEDQDFGLSRRDMDPTCVDLVLGEPKTPIGKVCAGTTGSSLTITYAVHATNTHTLSHVHAWVGTEMPTIKPPGRMPHTDENGACHIAPDRKSCVCTVPPDRFPPTCSGEFNVVAHAELAAGAGTAWGGGECYPDDKDKGNCAKFFVVHPQCKCPVVTSYKPVVHMNSYSTVKIITTTQATTVTCTSTPPAVTTSTPCKVHTAAPTVTVTSSKELQFTCNNPFTMPVP